VLREGFPILLTVEEAGELLRIGRTKAYAMAREWRETEGRSGLPVVDLGNVLRVPRRALEELLGAELSPVPYPYPANKATQTPVSAEPPQSQRDASNVPIETPPVRHPDTTGRSQRRRKAIANQLDLFDANPAAS
jgi:hypothetical protein